MAAQTPDAETPAEESICDDETGSLKGICNAYCEAMDCHLDEEVHASQKACDRVLDNYKRKSGGDLPPCLKSGCAATAKAKADANYHSCMSERSCDSQAGCAKRASHVFKSAYRACIHKCRRDCYVDYRACYVAGGDEDANRACKRAYTECTTSCFDHTDYVAPNICK